MKKITTLTILILSPLLSICQTNDKVANDAFVLISMVNKFHVDPRPVDGSFSKDVFARMLAKTDPGKLLFTQSDINRLTIYTTTIDKEIKQRKTDYLSLFTRLYTIRLKEADSVITIIDKTPLDLSLPERLTVTETNSYPASVKAMQVKLRKQLKSAVIEALIADMPANFKSFNQAKQKSYIDSAVTVLQRKISAYFKRRINGILQNPDGVDKYLDNLYCETIASCFDPHTEFFPPEKKENFESALGKQPFMFGFTIKEDKTGGIVIENLQPGSPAYKGGKLNKGDKFLAFQWEGSPPVDLTEISIEEFSAMVDENNHKRALFTMKKLDGTITHVWLQKEQVADNDGDRVKSFILNGPASKIGYIYLPAFYQDWETANNGLNGCANDVGREIIKLKQENITGLILDIRYNGGGSAEEATELTGIFIDAGPVEQFKEKDGKIFTFKDVDRGTIYDGPLVVLVNGQSASASELLAGTLQDYNRAIIVGAPTYGKATAQIVFPMDTTVTYDDMMQRQTEDYVKITTSKLYRVNGTSAQFTGVQPDIVLPDILDADVPKEADDPLALKPGTIAPNKYYQPYPPLPIKTLAAMVQPEINTNKYLNAVKALVAYSKQQKTEKDASLNLREVIATTNLNKRINLDADIIEPASTKFMVQNNQYEITRMVTDNNLKELNEEFSKKIISDAYISIAYDVLTKLNP
ncbi:MAG: S41 family peptidase [Sphingobacteriales bacterium]